MMEKNEYIIGGAVIAIVLIFAVLMAYGLGPQEVKLTAADNGSEIELKKGQTLAIPGSEPDHWLHVGDSGTW